MARSIRSRVFAMLDDGNDMKAIWLAMGQMRWNYLNRLRREWERERERERDAQMRRAGETDG